MYEYTSPLRKDFIIRKLMKFTVPDSVIPFDGDLEFLTMFDDIRLYQNVIFAADAPS
jgi:hypothetical protein